MACALTGLCVWQGGRGERDHVLLLIILLLAAGAASLSPSESVRSCGGIWFSLQVNSSVLRQRAGGCRCLPLFSSCPGAPASDGKKPLEARLSNGWSGINAPRGLCPPHRPFGDGERGALPLPSGIVLVMGVAGSERELLRSPVTAAPLWLRPTSPLWVRGGLVVGDGDGICPLQGNGSTS